MAYIGRPLNAGNLSVDVFTGNASTTVFTLTYSVGSSNSVGVYLDGVRQLGGTDFTASGTALTFTTAPANGVGIDVYFLGLELSLPTPADNTVSTAKIVDDAVTLAKMAPGTDGNIISYDASGNPVAIATGNDGQVLTSTGAGSPPAFETVSGGKVLQVVSTTFRGNASGTNRNSGSSGTTGGYSEAGTDWTDMDTSITPSATSSKILIITNVSFSMNNPAWGVYRIKRGINGATPSLSSSDAYIASPSGMGSNEIAGAKHNTTYDDSANGYNSKDFDFNFLDSPNTTNAVVYRINTLWESDASNHTIYLNTTYYDTNDYGTRHGVSTVTLMEIGA